MPWEHHPRLLSTAKRLVTRAGRRPRTIALGVFKGIKVELDLRHQTQLYLGLQEREIYSWLTRLSFNVVTAMDIGAAEGEYALYFLLKSSARFVVAFEPSEQARQRLTRNLELNSCAGDPRLTVYPHFASKRDFGVERTVDSLLPNIRPPCLIKVDVDGGELDVLQGAKSTLTRRDVSWIIETHSQELERRCRDLLSAAGLATTVVPNAWWRVLVPEMRPIPHNRWLIGIRP